MKSRPTGHIGSFIVGIGFEAGWTPCIGPILAGILTSAASSSSLTTGIQLLTVYSAGLAVPFFISALVLDKFLEIFQKFKKWLPWVNRTSGIILVILGIILLTGYLTILVGSLPTFDLPFQ